MDINQAARMIEWLDEERRSDKSTIATMQERLAQQQDTIEKLQSRVNGVESDQTVMKNQFVPNSRESDIMDQLRKEMRQLLETSESKRLNAEREAERRANLERQTLSRPVQELADKVTKIERATTEVPALHIERDRLMTTVAGLQQRIDDLYKKLEEPDRRLAFMEEQRRQDVRRLSELETNMPEVQKQIDGIRPKLTLIEDLALRNERRVQEVQNGDRERREQMQQFIDQQTLIMQQRDQEVKDLVKRFGEHDETMQKNIDRFETWSETYRNMKQIIEDFQRIGDRLERRINEVAEMQRLSEERFRQEWNDWRTTDQKRWKQFTLSNDEVWRNHDKDFERYVTHVEELHEAIQPLKDSIDRIWKLERQRAQLYRERYQELLHEYDQASPQGGNGNANNPFTPTDSLSGDSTTNGY
jgi:chromosome segregation ATPase